MVVAGGPKEAPIPTPRSVRRPGSPVRPLGQEGSGSSENEAIDKAKNGEKRENPTDEQAEKEAGEIAGEAISSPGLSREALFQTATLADTRAITGEINGLLEQKKIEGTLTKAETKRIKTLESQLKKAKKVEAQVRARAETLQEKGKTPEAKALGFDLTVALEQRSITEQKTFVEGQRAKLDTKDLDPQVKTAIEKSIEDAEKSIQTKTEKVQELKDKRKSLGENIPNQLTAVAEMVAGKKLTPEELENPMGVMEETMKKILSSEGSVEKDAFVERLKAGNLNLSNEQYRELSGLIADENLKDKDINVKGLAKKAGLGLIMMILMMIYAASKSAGIGAGGGHQ